MVGYFSDEDEIRIIKRAQQLGISTPGLDSWSEQLISKNNN